ncbi:GLPGLI family protein [Flavobacterium sp.]|uniref:GLPGLI family protein n=4 Tax=Flavobacterium sp. TaxID=239 RepID=UPI004048AD4C
MRKIIIFFLIVINSYSQDKGEILYKLYFNINEDNEEGFKKEIYNKIKPFSGELKFSLSYNQNLAVFRNIDENKINKDDKLALIYGKYFEYYIDRISKKTYRFNEESFIFFDKKQYLVFKEISNNWQITNEQKIIDGRNCFKAILYETAFYKKNNPQVKIEAWFCPEIPISLGPLNYSGLPGLILELNFNNISYVIDTINFSKDISLNFSKLEESTLISEEDYYALKKKISNEKKEEYEKQTQKSLINNFE